MSADEPPAVLVVGAGIAGLAAARSALARGARRVVVLERSLRCGGAAPSLRESGVLVAKPDEVGVGAEDTHEAVAKLLGSDPTDVVKWLDDVAGVSLSATRRLAGFYGDAKECFLPEEPDVAPTIRRGLLRALRAAGGGDSVRLLTDAEVLELLLAPDGACRGCRYIHGGEEHDLIGPVVIAAGGFGGDYSPSSLLALHRPDLLRLATACGEHSDGAALRLGLAAGGAALDLEWVQVSPLGLSHGGPGRRGALGARACAGVVRQAAPECLRLTGGLLLDGDGRRFCDEPADADSVACAMWRSRPPFRLVLNRAAAAEVLAECEALEQLGLMRRFEGVEALADDMGVPLAKLDEELLRRQVDATGDEHQHDGDGSRSSPAHNVIPVTAVKGAPFYVALVSPVLARCLGGLRADLRSGAVLRADGTGVVSGLFAAGEAVGGLRPLRRLPGGALLEALALGRAAGGAAAEALTAGGFDAAVVASCHGVGRPDVLDCGYDGEATPPPPPISGSPAMPPAAAATAEAKRLERMIYRRLTPALLEACLAKAHEGGGDFEAFAQQLRQSLVSEDIAEEAPVVQVQAWDPSRGGAVPTPLSRVVLPEGAGASAAEAQAACVHCRLPLTLEVGRDGYVPTAGTQALSPWEASTADEGAPSAYATLLYGNKAEYLLGALVLGWSLKQTGSSIDRLMMHTSDVPSEYLKVLQRFWILRPVQYLEGSQKLYKNFHQSRFQAVFTKLQALNCTDYSKVLMLDLDMLVRKPLDDLFELRAPAALKRASGRGQPPHGGPFHAEDLWHWSRDDMCSGINAGAMLLQPDQQVYERMVAEVQDDRHPEHLGTYGPEQDYLSRFYTTFFSGAWTHLHAKYNYQLMLPDDYVSEAHKAINIEEDVAIAHYSGPRVKPWKIGLGRDQEVGATALEAMLQDDGLREILGRGGASPSPSAAPRERIMDGVLVVEDPAAAGQALPPGVQAVMWEWVLALRSACRELSEAGVDLVAVVQEVQPGS